VGTRDAFVIGEAPRGTTHPIFQDAPRLVVEWDGSAWQPVAVADSFAAACQMIAQDGRPSLFPQAQSPLSPDRSSRWRPGPDRRHGD
jgi:hypothetical protein